MVRLNCVSSALPSHEVGIEETTEFLGRYASDALRPRLQRALASSGNRSRFSVLPLHDLARLQGASERGELYRTHATALGERVLASLADRGLLRGRELSAIVFASSTGWAAPSIDTHLVRRFGLNARCRRIPLAQLGCGGGVAALSLASEIASRDGGRVLVVSVELPSLHLQLAEPSYFELVAASQFGDGAAAAIVSSDDVGPEIVATESVLLGETEEGGRILASETGFRLIASSGLPELVEARVRELAGGFAAAHDVDVDALAFVLVHPRGPAVLDAAAAGLAIDSGKLAASRAAWAGTGNMISASIFRALGELMRQAPPRDGDLGMLIAFGTGVACEMALVRWRSSPDVVYC
jgi:alkylresorcinol/alkylpyrone synthase